MSKRSPSPQAPRRRIHAELGYFRHTMDCVLEDKLLAEYISRREDGWRLVAWHWEEEMEECIILWEREEDQ